MCHSGDRRGMLFAVRHKAQTQHHSFIATFHPPRCLDTRTSRPLQTMSAFYVCNTCRHRLARRVFRLPQPQWHSNRTFLSFANPGPPPPSNEPPKDTEESSVATPSPETSSGERQNKNKPFEVLFPELFARQAAGERGGRGRYSKRLSVEPSASEEEQTPNPHAINHVPIRHVHHDVHHPTHLKRLLNRPASRASDSWEYFLEHFPKGCSALSTPSPDDQRILGDGNLFRKQLNALLMEWCTNPQSTQCPSPADVVWTYQDLGTMRFEYWKECIWHLVAQLYNEPIEGGAEAQTLLMSQLMELWRAFFIQFSSKDPASILKGWTCISSSAHLDKLTTGNHVSTYLNQRLQSYIHIPNYEATQDISLSMIITFLFFTREKHLAGITANLRSEAYPFVRLVAHLIPGANLDPLVKEVESLKQSQDLSEESADHLLEEIGTLNTHALKIIGAKRFATAMPAAKDDASLARELEVFLIKRLARAFETEKISVAHNLWEEARSVFATPGSKSEFTIPSKIYDMLVSGFMQVGRADNAMMAWNEMLTNGATPTVVTWTAMLSGCEKGRDLNGLEQIWARMIASGVQPDHAAWSVRINALITLGRHGDGLAALSEMGREWTEYHNTGKLVSPKAKAKAKAVGKRPLKSAEPPKPNDIVINGTLSALSRAPLKNDKKRELIQKILRWAGSFQFVPDNVTYNALLRVALYNSDREMVFNLLRSMEKDGVEPDIATYTLLMRATMRTSLEELSADEQTNSVIGFLEDIESKGLKPNIIVYSSIVDRMLKDHNNFNAARAVLDHMARRQIIPSAQIYTSLITHYFGLDPPALDVVASLWDTIMNTPGSVTDRVLFDRFIEGYARHDQIGMMNTVLMRMSKEAKNPSWSALIEVVLALARTGDWQRLQQIVSDVQNKEGLARLGVSRRGGQGQAAAHFWRTVQDLGIETDPGSMASAVA